MPSRRPGEASSPRGGRSVKLRADRVVCGGRGDGGYRARAPAWQIAGFPRRVGAIPSWRAAVSKEVSKPVTHTANGTATAGVKNQVTVVPDS